MYLVQKNHVRPGKKDYTVLRIITKLSKNLYNYTLYHIRQFYESRNTFLPYGSAYHLVKDNENYQLLPSQVAQQTLKIVDRTFKSFLGLLKIRKNDDYNKTVGMPGFLPKDGHFICVFTKDVLKIEGDQIRLSLGRNFNRKYGVRYLYFTIPKNISGKRIKEVRILPRCNGLYFEIEYVYLKGPLETELDGDMYFSVDLGLDNFAACISTNGTSFILKGRGIKSFNRWWNKKNQSYNLYTPNKEYPEAENFVTST